MNVVQAAALGVLFGFTLGIAFWEWCMCYRMRTFLLIVALLLPAAAEAQDPPWLDALTDSVAAHEGFSATPYLDPPNNPAGWVAIGFGTNLDTGGISSAQQAECGVPERPETVTQEQGRCLVRTGLRSRWTRLLGDLPWLTGLPCTWQAGLTEMSYQLGVEGVERWNNTLGHIHDAERQIAMARGNILLSLWHEQTPARAEHLAAILEGACDR